MTVSRPGGRPTPTAKGAPPVPASRRSARQRRLANREANRSLSRAGTGGSGGGLNPIWAITILAAAAAILVVGFAYINTQQTGPKVLGTPFPPPSGFVTPSDIPQNGTTLGYADAKLTLEVWEDYQCPNCYGFTWDVESKLIANFVRNHDIKIVFKDLVILDPPNGSTHYSRDAANAALCGGDQGKYWLMHDWLFGNQGLEQSGAYSQDRLLLIGQLAGLDMSKFQPCVQNGSHYAAIQAEFNARPASSTPSIVLNGKLLSSYDYDTVAAAISSALHPECAAPTGAASDATFVPPSSCVSPSPSGSATPTATPTGSASASASATASPSPSPS